MLMWQTLCYLNHFLSPKVIKVILLVCVCWGCGYMHITASVQRPEVAMEI